MIERIIGGPSTKPVAPSLLIENRPLVRKRWLSSCAREDTLMAIGRDRRVHLHRCQLPMDLVASEMGNWPTA